MKLHRSARTTPKSRTLRVRRPRTHSAGERPSWLGTRSSWTVNPLERRGWGHSRHAVADCGERPRLCPQDDSEPATVLRVPPARAACGVVRHLREQRRWTRAAERHKLGRRRKRPFVLFDPDPGPRAERLSLLPVTERRLHTRADPGRPSAPSRYGAGAASKSVRCAAHPGSEPGSCSRSSARSLQLNSPEV